MIFLTTLFLSLASAEPQTNKERPVRVFIRSNLRIRKQATELAEDFQKQLTDPNFSVFYTTGLHYKPVEKENKK